MKKEIWKSVVGYEGLYEVSSIGRVRAMFVGNHGQFKPGRILKQTPLPNHYLMVGLYRPVIPKDGGRGTPHPGKLRSVHSLVLEAFKGKRPKGKVSRHLDGVRTHNSVDNLEWGTSAENAADAKRHGTFVFGEKNGYAKLTESQVLEIRRLRDLGYPCEAIGQRFGVDWSNVWLIGKRKTWRHLCELR